MAHNFRELKIWKESRILNGIIYESTKLYPNEELFGLVSQIRRSSVSISSNIAEGSAYDSSKMFLKHLNISKGSLAELESQLYLAYDLGYIDEREIKKLIERINTITKMIIGFVKSLT